ncbi:MAG: Holliday junction branch migration protein RuvA [Gemmatimonadetes bacterium]|nr:Holliday junction branch migration protein RuvA [Gemmatimonadota bacterium]MYJ39849.1 Holliday junction branch migration protein RuvA [Gemmatimonadota bacterium]
MPRLHRKAADPGEPDGDHPVISRIRGDLLGSDIDRVEVLTSGGVVYEVHVPLTVLQRLPPKGSTLELRTETVVRDEVPSLYGFLEENERALFRLLMTVQMVGPRLAMSMMSTYDARRLARALAEKDVPVLVQVSGLGKKTAARLILELADKVRNLAAAVEGDAPDTTQVAEAVSALVSLGYSFTDAEASVRDAMKDATFESTEEVIREVLSRRGRDR